MTERESGTLPPHRAHITWGTTSMMEKDETSLAWCQDFSFRERSTPRLHEGHDEAEMTAHAHCRVGVWPDAGSTRAAAPGPRTRVCGLGGPPRPPGWSYICTCTSVGPARVYRALPSAWNPTAGISHLPMTLGEGHTTKNWQS